MTELSSILVTGGAGYIGSHVCLALAEAGWTPVTYDNLATGHEWAVRFGPLERGDIRDQARLHDVMRRYRPIAVMHLAALTSVADSLRYPAQYYDVNLSGTVSLVSAMIQAGITNIVFSSTCAVYGSDDDTVGEESALDPETPYGASKLFAERLLGDAARSGSLRPAILRYFNAAGAAPEAGIGQAHHDAQALIPNLLDGAMGIGAGFRLHGRDYATEDGTCVRISCMYRIWPMPISSLCSI